MSTGNNNNHGNNAASSCANCGKGEEGSGDLKACTACKLVKYCHVTCQKAHRKQHKKECRKRAAEIHDEKLFKQPPRREECPICFLRMPSFEMGWKYNACCGKIICSGCAYAGAKMDGNVDQLCPFCRAVAPKTDEEGMKQIQKRVEVDDAQAIYELGVCYSQGIYGLPQDYAKASELWLQAGQLGNAGSYNNVGVTYDNGLGK